LQAFQREVVQCREAVSVSSPRCSTEAHEGRVAHPTFQSQPYFVGWMFPQGWAGVCRVARRFPPSGSGLDQSADQAAAGEGFASLRLRGFC
jgi:hypothetical protein